MSLDKPAKELIVDMINSSRKRFYFKAIPYALSEITLELPESTAYDHEKNTDLVVKSAVGVTPLPAPRHIYYNRIPLTTHVNHVLGEGAVPQIEDEGFTTVSDLLPAINTLLSIQLTVGDIDNDALPAEGDYPRNVMLRVKPSCLIFTGQLPLELIDNVQS